MRDDHYKWRLLRKTWRAYCETYCQPAVKSAGWQHWHGKFRHCPAVRYRDQVRRARLRVYISSLKMSIHYSGCRTRSIGVMSAIIKQLKRINLTPVKRIDFRFDPFHKDVKHTRLVSLKLSAHHSDFAEILKRDWYNNFFFFPVASIRILAFSIILVFLNKIYP